MRQVPSYATQSRTPRNRWIGLAAALILAMLLGLSANQALTSPPPVVNPGFEPYPVKPVTLLVTFPPGGGTDLLARKLASYLEQTLGQPWIVENRPGASGNIGARMTASAKPDGYTLLMVNSSFAINPAVFSHLDFDPKNDFEAIVNVASVPSVLVAAPDSPLKSFADLMQAANTEEGVHFASCGNGTPQHLVAGMLQEQGARHLLQVPYKGCGPALIDVLAAQVPLGIVTLSSAAPLIETGRLRALAVSSRQRHPTLPQVPSVAELTHSGFDLDQWHGVLAPAGIPERIRQQLNRAFNDLLGLPQLQQDLQALGYSINTQSATEFQQLIWADIDRFEQLSEKMGLRLN